MTGVQEMKIAFKCVPDAVVLPVGRGEKNA
jgi:hypothetical protein